MTRATSDTERRTVAPEKSAGRAAGYCWAQHPTTRVHCTEPPRHAGNHWHTYTKTGWS